jgi:hypothetical protein
VSATTRSDFVEHGVGSIAATVEGLRGNSCRWMPPTLADARGAQVHTSPSHPTGVPLSQLEFDAVSEARASDASERRLPRVGASTLEVTVALVA